MKVEIGEDVWGEAEVLLDGYHWFGKSQTYVFWWADVVDPFEWFFNVITQHQKNSPCLNLSLERKFWILCFQVTRN